jgi:hypothetical protein
MMVSGPDGLDHLPGLAAPKNVSLATNPRYRDASPRRALPAG